MGFNEKKNANLGGGDKVHIFLLSTGSKHAI